MKRITKKEIMELIKKEHRATVEKIENFKHELINNDEVIKKLIDLKIINPSSVKTEVGYREDLLSLMNGRLKKYEIDARIRGCTINNDEIERIADNTLFTIDTMYEVKNNTITYKTYNVVREYFLKNEKYIDEYELTKILETISNVFHLNLDINKIRQDVDQKFVFGINNLDDKHNIKIFKNGKITIIEK